MRMRDKRAIVCRAENVRHSQVALRSLDRQKRASRNDSGKI
jgi:hypothetical protein